MKISVTAKYCERLSNLFLCVVVICCVGCSLVGGEAGDCTQTFNVYNWQMRVGAETGIWVSIERQEFALISHNQIVQRYRCSTALAGAGNNVDSGKTPLGWHTIGAKNGGDLPQGAVLKDRQWTGDIWKEGQDAQEDLILSRILWLEGTEGGCNRGGDVDTRSRYIYIHGTNQIDDLGRPASAGCVRMDPAEVIDLYERVEVGTPVLITID
jgi:L,D-transpeptidase YbiS